jgi:hypothetical protein
MLADALQHPGPPRTQCTCPDLAAGRLDRNCPLHGVVAQDELAGTNAEADFSDAADESSDLDIAEELEIEDRLIRMRGYLAHIHRLGVGESQMTMAKVLDLLERLVTPPDAYQWINEG